MTSARRTSARAFAQLLTLEARSKGGGLLLGALLAAGLNVFIAWRLPNPQLQAAVALLVAALPSLYWVFGGLGAFTPEFGSGAHLLLRSVPASGLTVVLAKYTWLLIELLVLAALLAGSALYFLNGVVPLREVVFAPGSGERLALITSCGLLVPPAIAIASGVVGRASRWHLLGGFAAFALLWWSFALLFEAAGGLNALGSASVTFARLPSEVCAVRGDCFVRVSTAALLLQPALALFLLWLAGRTLDSLDG